MVKVLSLILLICFLYFTLLKKIRIENFISVNKELFFIHIPKNGGTSIENTGKEHNINWGKNLKLNLKEKRCSYWHLPIKYINPKYYKNKVLFCIVRNPYNRIVSEYKFITKNKKKLSGKNLNLFVKEKLEEYKNDKFINDCHIMPQTEFIKDKNGKLLKNLEILKFENLENDFQKLLKKYNYPKMNLRNDNKTPKDITYKDLNDESINLINDFYSEDFSFFNYSKIQK